MRPIATLDAKAPEWSDSEGSLMAFEVIDYNGGVVVPGTSFLIPMERNGNPGFAVMVGVFDTTAFPGRRVNMYFGWASRRGMAEFTQEFIDSGCNTKLDLAKMFPGAKISNVRLVKHYGHLSSVLI